MAEEEYSEEHKQHLCYMVARKGLLMEDNLKTLKKMVSKANFVCETCGRAATKAENLCHPIKL
ncbi:MAG: hypothetical protein ACFFA5_05275 [Promethearchaeota archaeon]